MPVNHQIEVSFLTQPPGPVVLCVEIPGIGIAGTAHEFLQRCGLDQYVVMGCHKSVCEQAGVGAQCSCGKAVESDAKIFRAAEHYFFVRREAHVIYSCLIHGRNLAQRSSLQLSY